TSRQRTPSPDRDVTYPVTSPPSTSLFTASSSPLSCRAVRDLHSLPTRRSSGLAQHRTTASHLLVTAYRSTKRRRIACAVASSARAEEHTSELQSRENLVCRLLLEKKNTPGSLPIPSSPRPTPFTWSAAPQTTRL